MPDVNNKELAANLRQLLQDPDVGHFYNYEQRCKMVNELERLEGKKIEGNSLWTAKIGRHE